MTILISLFILICIFWYYKIPTYSKISLDNFNGSNASNKNNDYNKLLFFSYLKQQKWSFGLLWFAIAISLVIALVIILRIINKDLDLGILKEAIGLAGGVTFSLSSFKLYNIASKKIDDFITKL